MSDIAARVRALERAVTDHDDPLELPDVARLADDVAALQDRVEDLDARVASLTARQQAVEGYVDRVDHVNESVERRADAALAAVDRLEAAAVTDEQSGSPSVEPPPPVPDAAARGAESSVESAAEDSPGVFARLRDAL